MASATLQPKSLFRERLHKQKLSTETSRSEIIPEATSYHKELVDAGQFEEADRIKNDMEDYEEGLLKQRTALHSMDTNVARMIQTEEIKTNDETSTIDKLERLSNASK